MAKRHGPGLITEVTRVLIHIRELARREKDFAESDRLRVELLSLGIICEDGVDKTEYRGEFDYQFIPRSVIDR